MNVTNKESLAAPAAENKVVEEEMVTVKGSAAPITEENVGKGLAVPVKGKKVTSKALAAAVKEKKVTGKQASKLTGKEALAAAVEEDTVIGKEACKRHHDKKKLVDVDDSKKRKKV